MRVLVSDRKPIRRALVSVYDKTGIVELAGRLADAGVEIVSTGSTADRVAAAGVAVTRVEAVTDFPEILDGRVKTLHPRIHAGILADTRKGAHVMQLRDLDIATFEVVVGNLYPFAETVAAGASAAECVEKIDIGGPAMIRAAAKNHASVAVVVDTADYDHLVAAAQGEGFTLSERIALAAKAFGHTAGYDVAVAQWMSQAAEQSTAEQSTTARAGSESKAVEFPNFTGATWERADVLRYGENPHQVAALYVSATGNPGVAGARQLHGKQMSYNNYTDADAAWRAAFDHPDPAVAIIKHANPCGIAIAEDIATAHRKAHDCDPVSAFGGVVAANREVSVTMAEQLAEIFTEVIIAPAYADGALAVLQRKKNVRVLVAAAPERGGREIRPISGGVLVQEQDALDAPGDDPAHWNLVAGKPVSAGTLADLVFAWRACRAAKSNAILLARDGAAVGVGMGQVNRVDAVRLAVTRAGERVRGAVAASDAYFPFSDGPQVLVEAGVRAIVQPGGSVRDQETVDVVRKAGVALYMTGARHFSH